MFSSRESPDAITARQKLSTFKHQRRQMLSPSVPGSQFHASQRHDQLSAEAEAVMKTTLKHEYDFYEFVNARLSEQIEEL